MHLLCVLILAVFVQNLGNYHSDNEFEYFQKDRMAADCALELKSHNVTYISLWPGPVKTELINASKDYRHQVEKAAQGETIKLGANKYVMSAFDQGESIEFAGKCIVALAAGESCYCEKKSKFF